MLVSVLYILILRFGWVKFVQKYKFFHCALTTVSEKKLSSFSVSSLVFITVFGRSGFVVISDKSELIFIATSYFFHPEINFYFYIL